LATALAVATFAAAGCTPRRDVSAMKKVVVLGIDGMDYAVVRRLIDEGRLPNLARMERSGGFTPLQTSVPPQSPVAWSDFITGMDSGGHGIFDFLHRDPETMFPYLSTSRAVGTERTMKIGGYQIPLEGGSVELLRKGEAFWEVLERNGIESTIVRMPANYPPSGKATRELSGMGTPDVLGTYGTFSFFTSEPFAFQGESLGGGKVFPVHLNNNVVEADLVGPDNPFRVEKTKLKIPFRVFVDSDEPTALIEIGDHRRVLRVGEWTDWLPVEFEMVPTQTLPVEARFYLKAVDPYFELFVTPLNLDPNQPAQPISVPADYAAELARATGLYFTQGMPEDTHSLKQGVLDRKEFLVQSRLTANEMIEQFRYVMGRHQGGFLFYYFGNLDQVSHMMWRPMDPEHPSYDAEKDSPFAKVVEDIYIELDGVVGEALDRIGDRGTLIVMSDHGFTSWRRSFHLNAWLVENGYLTPRDSNESNDSGFLTNIDWPRTQAYGLGINGLYLNLRGREREGTVSPSEYDKLLKEIGDKLLALKDPKTGKAAVTKVYKSKEYYQDRGALGVGPDMQIGYAKGTRAADAAAGGTVIGTVLSDNAMEWSGDHCMDHEAVPGVLFSNRPLQRPVTALKNLAAGILAEYGITGFPSRSGTDKE
jgi:predicted AlkP superfamily phosphohydrolase/phosphomutase